MRPITFTYSPTVLTANAVAASQTPAAAGAVTIDGTLATGGVATLGAQQFVTIVSGFNISNRTFVVTGTDNNGNAVSETITGPNNATVVSLKQYKTVTSVTISGTAAGAITMGVNGQGASQPIPFDTYITPFSASVTTSLVTGGTYKLQYTYSDIQAASWANSTQNWFDHATFTGKTAVFDVALTAPVTAVRFVITTAGSPQGFTAIIIQAGGP